jgi:D-3-phosphoglycerate dehydrogenase
MRQRVVLAYAGLGDGGIEQEVFGAGDVEVTMVDHLDSPEGVAVARNTDALMVTVQPVSGRLLASMERCKVVTRVGTGVDAIDIATPTARGIWVTNVPDYSIDEVSTHALALLLAQARNLPAHLTAAATGNWRYQWETPIRRYNRLTLGILGFGRIGSAMGRKGLGTGLRVIACDPYVCEERITEVGAEPVDFDTLLRTSDFLSLHVPLTDTTRGIIDGRALSLMQQSAYIVNTSRGEVIDTDALVVAVQRGQIAGAALDVLPVEPPPPNDPVMHEPKILVTPHVAWASEEAAQDVKRRGAEDVLRVLRGERPRCPVNDVDRVSAAIGGSA